jgi:arylsulfatase A-like enzyme
MMRWALVIVALSLSVPAGPVMAAAPERPNVLFILADDLGWRDTALYGSAFCRTPAIDRLATRGMTFSRAYSASPLCSPTRASILTGLYPARVGITTPACHLPQEVLESGLQKQASPGQKALPAISATRLKAEYVTLAEIFQSAGYRTGHFGKWHLGPEPFDPLHQGFDVDVPHWPGPGPAGSYVAPWKFTAKLDFQGKPGEHLEDRMAEEAVRFIRKHKGEPFYLNYWAFSVHAPFDAKPELIDQYESRVRPDDPQKCPTYGAMVHSLDDAVGRLVKTLDEEGLAERTILVFFSDNGGNMYDRVKGVPPTSNQPLRSGKGNIYDGGVRVPMVVIAPGLVKPGSRSDALVSSVDFHPTLLEMAGLKPKAGAALDGVSLVSALRGEPFDRGAIFCHFPHYVPATENLPAASVYEGDWKLIRFFCDGEGQKDRQELYNLKEDLGETKDQAAAQPDRVKAMGARLDRFLKETGAQVPVPNPKFDPAAGGPFKAKEEKARPARDAKQ